MVCQEDGSIDPFFVRDENGHPYLIWKEDANSRNQPSPIFAQPTTDDGLQLTGSPRELIRSDVAWEGHVVEGPDVLRHGDYYYLFYAGGACCGTRCDYGVGVARAKQVLGPWEKAAANPIVTANADWRCPGHGTTVSGPDGADYLLYHAYAQRGFVFTGREALLDRIEWRDGWPVIDAGKGPSSEGEKLPAPVRDEFRGRALDPGWQWPLREKPVIQVTGGRLQLTGEAGKDLGFLGGVLARSLAATDYSAETAVARATVQDGAAAGLAVVGDRRNAAGIGVRSGRMLQWRIDGGKWTQLADAPAPGAQELRLRIDARGATQFQTWYRDGTEWKQLGELVDVSKLPPWDRGLRIALFAGEGGAVFSRFQLTYGK